MLFTDNKARYVNDIVTIIIDESSSGQNKASTNTSKNSATSAGISALLGLDTSIINANANLGERFPLGANPPARSRGPGTPPGGARCRPA